MSSTLRKKRKSSHQARKQLGELLKDAREQVRGKRAHSSVGVHEARKDIKKARSILSLTDPSHRSKHTRRMDAALRKSGKALSLDRDQQVVAELVDQWSEEASETRSPLLFKTLHNLNAALATEATKKKRSSGAPRFRKSIKLARSHYHKLPSLAKCAGRIQQGVDRSWQRLMHGFENYAVHPNPKNLHRWRKNTKDHYYHLQFLRSRHPHYEETHSDLAQMENCLSIAKDCDLVTDYIREHHGESLSPREFRSLMQHAQRRRQAAIDHAEDHLSLILAARV